MREREFEYGPLAKGTYVGLVAVFAPVALAFPQWAPRYLLFLLFLGLGLRFLLERTGLYRLWASFKVGLTEKWDRKFLARHRSEIDRKQRAEKYHRSRVKDPGLPKNW